MPIYEYACRRCGASFEEIRRAENRLDAPPCTACGAAETSLRLSAPGFVGAAAGGAAPGACSTDPGSCCGGVCMN
jgi:putative FmdB family regulatory protein